MNDVLEQFFGGQAVAEPPKKPAESTRVASDVQAQRDKDSLSILQSELSKAQAALTKATDPKQKLRLEADIAGLTREISRAPASKAQPTAQPAAQPSAPIAASGDPLEAFLSGKTATAPVAAKAAPVAPQAAPAATIEQPPTSGARQAIAQTAAQFTEPGGVRQLVGKFLKGALETKREIPERVAGAIDTLYGIVPATYGAAVQALARTAQSPERAEQTGQAAAASIDKPLGKALGLTGKETYQKPLGGITEPIVEQVKKMAEQLGMTPKQISEKTGIPEQDIKNMVVIGSVAVPQAIKEVAPVVKETVQAVTTPIKQAAAELQVVKPGQAPGQPAQPRMVSMGAAAVPDAATIKQALSVATPELQKALANIPPEKVNLPTLQRHIEADTLPVPVRLTEGQATGDIVKLSNEQNRRGKDPSLAQRFNEQNGQLVENLGLIREKAAPDVYGTKTIENSQGIIDAYKSMDANLNQGINAKYQALRDAAGGQFPVDAPKLLQNIEIKLKKELLSNEAPKGQFSELQRLAKDNNMTFEDYLSLRRNLGDIARTAKDGAERKAASFMIEELEKLPLQESAQRLKPLADQARKAARDRFQMLEKDPAYKAAVDDLVPADKYIDKFVINGVNKNINTMVQNLGKDSPAHQHMAAGTVNWLKDKAGIVDETGNFQQSGYNKALKKLDDVKNLQEIFNPEAASQLKTLGNVARYTQAQPRGAFVNNSNTLVGAMADKAAYAMEQGANIVGGGKMGIPIGSMIRSRVQQYKATKETEKALETGAGTKQTGQ